MEGVSDHPRSRGVYPATKVAGALSSGSSPLARGLPTAISGACAQPRIIPARAGFTRARQRPQFSWQDHPRSRGVYAVADYSGSAGIGSSPLARGLRVRPVYPERGPGIIPARAGFTSWGESGRPNGSDHPRSRGVYAVALCSWVPSPGSSPLARGLREPAGGPLGIPRIIPARAGFTLIRDDRGRVVGDHPRSRGVYTRRGGHRMVTAGSSPLARGLPESTKHSPILFRIIPARAGFTHLGM